MKVSILYPHQRLIFNLNLPEIILSAILLSYLQYLYRFRLPIPIIKIQPNLNLALTRPQLEPVTDCVNNQNLTYPELTM